MAKWINRSFFVTRTSNFWSEAECSFKNIVKTILRISSSNVLKMFLNKIVSIGLQFVIIYSHKPVGSINTLMTNKNVLKQSCTCTTLQAMLH